MQRIRVAFPHLFTKQYVKREWCTKNKNKSKHKESLWTFDSHEYLNSLIPQNKLLKIYNWCKIANILNQTHIFTFQNCGHSVFSKIFWKENHKNDCIGSLVFQLSYGFQGKKKKGKMACLALKTCTLCVLERSKANDKIIISNILTNDLDKAMKWWIMNFAGHAKLHNYVT